ncbi:MAG: N-acetylmuramoyl-L-alanine amidase [Dethiobacteria bacterium]|jgi:N-acetylmuramoyl-L-alanine amidase
MGSLTGRGKKNCIVSAVALPVVVFLISTVFILAFNGRAAAADFPDLHGHWAATEILVAAEAGYIKGYPDGAFRPDRKITRAEFVSIVNNYFRFKAPESFTGFKDVAGNDWFFTEIGKATAAGYFQGYPGGFFYPDAAITRQEVAGVLGRILALEEAAGAGEALNFTDAGQIGAWARPSVAGLASRGLFAGYPDGSFRPRQAVTRAEAAVLIFKVKDYLQEKVATSYLEVEGDVVNIRSGPGQSFGVLGKVKLEEVLKAESFCNGWYMVEYRGEAGWIAGWLVREHDVLPPQQGEPGEPSKPGEPGTLKIEVLPGEGELAVNLFAGPDADYRWEEKQVSNRLLVSVTGVDSLDSPRNLAVGQAGLKQITSRLSGGVAEVEFQFAASPAPVAYSVEEKGTGQLQVVVPYQLLGLDIEETDELVVVRLQATVPINYEAFRLRNPQRIVVDFPNLTLNPDLAGWEKGFALPFLRSLRLGQFLPEVARLVADLNAAASYEIIPEAKSNTLTIELRKATVQGKRVCLDPGHGGSDPGAVGPTGLMEKEVNLAIALQTAELLRAAGMEVILTREEDYYVDLFSRAAIANNSEADVFVSIHANAALNNPAVGGTSTYTYYGWQKEERAYLSRLLQEELIAALGLRDIGIFNEGFAVIRNTQMPAALVEVAFISNPVEEKLLAGRDFQQRAAGALAQAITRFFTE